jgi:branched-chain amino acid transport system ATP-binding protein/urea transport system ATP-binding protein
MLRVQGLHAGYGASEVLHGVDLTVEQGGVTALMGRNGMGKTTLLRTIIGQLNSRLGTVTFKGQPITGWPTHRIARLGLGYVPQGREVFDDFTVEENLRLGLLGHGKGASAVPERLYQWFPILEERRRQKAGTFSGGQQQMLAIARALAAEPDMLLLDEPTEGIQPSIVHEIGETIARIASDTSLTVLVVEQNVDLVLTVAQSVAFMDNGVIVEHCGAGDLARDDTILHHHLSI